MCVMLSTHAPTNPPAAISLGTHAANAALSRACGDGLLRGRFAAPSDGTIGHRTSAVARLAAEEGDAELAQQLRP